MNTRTANALFLSGLLLGALSWLIDRTLNEEYSAKVSRFNRLGEDSFRASVGMKLEQLVASEETARMNGEVAWIDRALEQRMPPDERRGLEARRAGLLDAVADRESAARKYMEGVARDLVDVMAPLAPAESKQYSAQHAAVFSAMDQLLAADNRARAEGRAVTKEFEMLSSRTYSQYVEFLRASDSYMAAVRKGKEDLDKSAERTRRAFLTLYVLSAFLLALGQLGKK